MLPENVFGSQAIWYIANNHCLPFLLIWQHSSQIYIAVLTAFATAAVSNVAVFLQSAGMFQETSLLLVQKRSQLEQIIYDQTPPRQLETLNRNRQ